MSFTKKADKGEEETGPKKEFIHCCHCNRLVEVDRTDRSELFCWGCKQMATPEGGAMLDGNLGSLAYKLVMLTADRKLDKFKAIELFNRAKADSATCDALLARATKALAPDQARGLDG